jgi:hypothetical protein
VVVVGVLVGALLVGAGLLLTNGKDDDSPSAAATPTCTQVADTATAPPTAPVTINVYNSTSRAGLARDTADALEGRGFKIAAVANDPKKATIAGTAVVRHVSTALEQARWAAAQVPGSTLQQVAATGRKGAKVDVVIGAGYTTLATPAEAQAAFVASGPKTGC